MRKIISESDIEESTLELLEELGYTVLYGSDISEGGDYAERKYDEVVLKARLTQALTRFNKHIPQNVIYEVISEAVKRITSPESQNLIANNKKFHNFLTDGVPVEYNTNNGIKNDIVHLFDFNDIDNNEFLAVNQFTIKEGRENRRPDIILFINGLPLVLIELKNPTDKNATIWNAFTQFQTYKDLIPSIFMFNEILIISDGLQARAGTLTSGKDRFAPWKSIGGEKEPSGRQNPLSNVPQIEVLIKGMLNREVLLDLIRHFIVFESDTNINKDIDKPGENKTSGTISKKIAAYHQYYAVNKAVFSTVNAAKGDDKRAGIVWHTQGSGKSLSMVFYAGKLVLQRELNNPTLILLTDRNDLDDQLFGTFSRCRELLRQSPRQANSRDEIKELLRVSSGGVIFTTIQKFMPEKKGFKYPLLSDRNNIIVIADEAHRSQYDFIDGFARNLRDALPNASFIGFTGTPIEKADRSTPAVFGKYVDIYDIEQSIKDGMTVPIYYENRLAKLELKPEEIPQIDKEFEEITEGEEIERKEILKSKWANIEKLVGSEDRIRRIATDIVIHWESRLKALEGKAMIVCMSRRICIELNNEIIKLRPDWYDKDDDKGAIKVVMTGSASDDPLWQEHIRTKQRRQAIGQRFKEHSSGLKIAIVRDMWLTGFDIPSLNTMYLDKPMRGHNLMQAIARVNRVFRDKPGGLIVDYIGIYFDLEKALSDYTAGDKKQVGISQEEAVALMKEKYEIIVDLFHGFDYKKVFDVKVMNKMQVIINAEEHIYSQKDGKDIFLKNIATLSKAFALAVPHEETARISGEVGFFQSVRSAIIKLSGSKEIDEQKDYDSAIKQILSKSIVSDRVIDIFAAAGLKKPDISILSDEFLREIKEMPQKNLAFEALKKLLNDEIKIRQKKNLVQSRSFLELLNKAIKAYTNKNIETAEVIEQLLELAVKMRESYKRDESLGLTEDEIAFYDALGVSDSAVKVLGDKTLKVIAKELTEAIHRNVTIDWTKKESVQAQMRLMVKKILEKHGYPPNKLEKARETVLEQARELCADWSEKAENFKYSAGEAVNKEKEDGIDFKSGIIPYDAVDENQKYVEYLPVYSLEAAASGFSGEQHVETLGWKKVDINIIENNGIRQNFGTLNRDMFIAKVVGKSMEPTIPDGSYCIFRFERGGSRNGKVVLVESRKVSDTETNQKYTVKRYRSEKVNTDYSLDSRFRGNDNEYAEEGGEQWEHKRIILSPDNKDFDDIILENVSEDDFKVIAEFVSII
jgi:type I restriction enzyme R subunit